MRFYETMFILKPTLTQEETTAKIDFFKSVLTNNGASIEATIDMGIRNLAYEIKKCKRGYYFVIYFKANPTLVAELERNYRINEEVIRFIVINYKNKTEQKNWGILVDKANGKYVEPKRKKKADSAESNADSAVDSAKQSEGDNV
ncbi:30S ribosomal protein S6 [Helicobacter sp. 23-1044]